MHILIVSQTFPPATSTRAIQIGKVVKALQENTCRTTVIAGAGRNHSAEHLSSAQVVYLPCWRRNGHGSALARLSGRLKAELYSCWSRNSWVRDAAAQATEIIEKHKPDCVMTASTPFESHLAGLAIKRKTGLPWAAYFSDPWPAAIVAPPYGPNSIPLLSAIQKSYLCKVLSICDAVIMPNKYAIKLMEEKAAVPIAAKSCVIPHIGSSITATSDDKGNGYVAHVGHLMRERVSKPFLEGLRLAVDTIGPSFHGLMCVGNTCPEFRSLVRRLNLDEHVEYVGSLPHEKALKVCRGATALLVLEADMPESPFLPSKFADYVFAGRPIIAVTPAVSAIRDYLNDYGGGIPVRNVPEEISQALADMFSANNAVKQPIDGDMPPLAQAFSSSAVGMEYRRMFTALLSRSNLL